MLRLANAFPSLSLCRLQRFCISYSSIVCGKNIEISESDIEENFVQGSGPGGQKINKTANCVQIKHIPTGIRVSCQQSRSLEINRHIARKILREKLDWHFNQWDSKLGQKIQKKRRAKAKSAKRSEGKYNVERDSPTESELDPSIMHHMEELDGNDK